MLKPTSAHRGATLNTAIAEPSAVALPSHEEGEASS